MDYSYLLFIAVILLSTKVFGLLSEKVHMPQVVGALVAGVILGPSVSGFVTESDFLTKTAEIGVILLMFLAGLETDLEELKANGKASFFVALLGVVVPLVAGFGVYYLFFPEIVREGSIGILKGVFIGATLTATSVSITVETLREMGKLHGAMGTTILGAAIIDDIIGIIVLTIIVGMTDTSVQLGSVLLSILEFFVCIGVIGSLVYFVKQKFVHNVRKRRRITIYALAFCLILSFVAERYFGVADITGAYFAGIILCNFGIKKYIDERFSTLSYLFFSPIFFASVGLKADISNLTGNLVFFAFVLLIVAIITKIIGCGLTAKMFRFNNKDALAIGIGMVSRGEVALIVAQKGADAGLLETSLFPPIVLMVIVTTLFTPILLKVILREKDEITQTQYKKATEIMQD